MSQILSVVISILLMIPAPGVQGCFSNVTCCSKHTLRHLETHVQRATRQIRSLASSAASSNGCQASSEGLDRQRSISPWSWVKDSDETRYPQVIWNAQCNCLSSCVDLSSCVNEGEKKIYRKATRRGNSIPIQQHTLVYYRKPCPNTPDFFYLEAAVYKMNVSCTCVVPVGGLCVSR